MKSVLKKLTTVILSVSILITCAGFAVSAAEATKLTPRAAVTIDARNYSRASGTLREEGGCLSFQTSQWAEFDVTVAEAGEYELAVISGAPRERNFNVTLNGKDLGKVTCAATSAYADTVEETAKTVSLQAGINAIRIVNGGSAFYFKAVVFYPLGLSEDTETEKNGPFREFELPTIIQAEDYDCGTSGSYSIDGKNNGRPYRSEDIDVHMESGKKTYYISLSKEEYVKYTFDVTEDGVYTLYIKGYAALADIYVDNMETPILSNQLIDANYGECEFIKIKLTEGSHILKLKSNGGIFELDYLRFAVYEGEYEIVGEGEDTEKNPVFKNLYVAENGDDKNPGTKDAPFKTIKRAKEEISKINDDMNGDIVVNIASGYYQLSETEVFNKTHSGKNGYNIIFKGEDENNLPVISGGKRVSGWEKVSDIFWRAPIETESAVRNLYVNGVPAIRARSKYLYMHEGDYDILGNAYPQDGFVTSAVNFPVQVVEEDGIELVWNTAWASQRALVIDIFEENGKIVFLMEPEYWQNRSGSATMNAGNTFYIENSFALMDEPGEYYYNQEEGYIYYYPYAEEDLTTADVYIGELEGLMALEGNGINDKIENISFSNLDFRYGAWNHVSKVGFNIQQADKMKLIGGNDIPLIPGQISINYADNIDFHNSVFSCLGSVGISMVEGVSNTDIKGNVFKDISASGILCGTPDHQVVAQGSEICKNINIENNVFRRNACEYYGSVSVLVFYERNINIIHNSFIDATYSQVSAGWGWEGGSSKISGEYTIAYNFFDDAMHTLYDGAHVYTLGANYNSSINNNYFLRVGLGGEPFGGVYTDSGSAYFTIENNVFEDTPEMWEVGLYGTHDMIARHNFVEREPGLALDRGVNNIAEDIIIKNGEWPSEAQEIIKEAGVEDEYKYLLELSEQPEWVRSKTKTVPRKPYASEEWIEAEDFMEGGQGVGYYKQADNPKNNPYRDDGVNLARNSAGTGYFIHNNTSGEWMKYEFEVPEDGIYDLYIRAAQNWGESNAQPGLQISVDDKIVIEDFLVPRTLSWNMFENFMAGKVELTKGKHIMKMEITHNGLYIDGTKFVPDGVSLGLVQDANFDEGKIVYQEVYRTGDTENEESSFKDIKGHWAETNINKMSECGYVNGYNADVFAPDDNVTLYQAIWLSMRCMNLVYNEGSWQSDAMQYGIIDKKYESDKDITREEFIQIVLNAYEAKNGEISINESTSFPDEKAITPSYLGAVLKAKGEGFIVGDDNGYFNPKKVLSRAEAVTVLCNILK